LFGLFSRLSAKKKFGGVIGIATAEESLVMVHVAKDAKGHARIADAKVVRERDPQKREAALAEWVRNKRLRGYPAVITLQPGAFGVHQIERPEVPDVELRAAVRWKIKDFIDYPPNQAIVDVFAVPDGRQTRKASIYVVSARNADMTARVAMVKAAGLDPNRVDIADLALRSLVNRALDIDETVAVLLLMERRGQIQICRGDTFYLARALDFGLSSLSAPPSDQGLSFTNTDVDDRIALEIQRTMDYYDSNFGQAPVRRLLMIGDGDGLVRLAAYVETALGLKAEVFDCATLSQSAQGPQVGPSELFPIALGGAVGVLG